MPDYRKTPSQSGARVDSPTLSEELNFSIETTTMRLKSLKLRRAEAADKAMDDRLRPETHSERPPAAASRGPVGRVRHDERGMAVWDWAAAVGDTAALSATNIMRTLDVSGLSVEQTQRSLKAMELKANPGGGHDPYNQTSYKAKNAVPGAKKPNSVLDQLTGKKK